MRMSKPSRGQTATSGCQTDDAARGGQRARPRPTDPPRAAAREEVRPTSHNPRIPVTKRLVEVHDARSILNTRRRAREEAELSHVGDSEPRGRRGGRYDPEHDWSPSPEGPGLRAFGHAIQNAEFLP